MSAAAPRRLLARFAILTAACFVAIPLAWSGCRPTRPPQASPPTTAPAGPANQLTVFVTGATSGNLEPCNCPGQPRGGLSRRQTLLGQLRQRLGAGLLLDCGNLLGVEPDRIQDRYLISGYRLLRYDAIAVGDQDLGQGVARLAPALKGDDALPMVATNLSTSGIALGKPYRWLDRNGRSAVVLSVVGPLAMAFSSQAGGQILVEEPADAVRSALARAQRERRDRPDLVVVLACLDVSEAPQVLADLAAVRAWDSGIDLVVLAADQARPVQLETDTGVPAVYAPQRGEQLAAVTFRFGGDQAKTSALAPPVAGSAARVIAVEPCPVEQALPRDKALWENYQAYTFDAQRQAQSLPSKLGPIKLAPSADCGQCHLVQHEAWTKHAHGQAWQTIVTEGRTRDPACARCHSTGFGYVGGFTTAEETPQLRNVGCQDCHWIDMTAAPVDPKARPLVKPHKDAAKIDPEHCRICHTVAKSPDFNPKDYLPEATCPIAKAGETKAAPTTAPAKP